MRKSYAFLCKVSSIKYSCFECFKQNKILFFSLFFICILGILTGIFVAFKCGITTATLTDYNLGIYYCSENSCFQNFIARFFSCFINVLILAVSSLYALIIPIGYVAIGYRGYLIGFNTALLISLFGISGAISGIIIILPCQLLISFTLLTYFVLLINRSKQKKKFGTSKLSFIKTTLIFVIILALLCLIESLLLTIFSASTILVI